MHCTCTISMIRSKEINFLTKHHTLDKSRLKKDSLSFPFSSASTSASLSVMNGFTQDNRNVYHSLELLR